MIKVFDPFQSKIKLHIGTDFLQRLWDRYVPVSSNAYENISLIHLSRMTEAGEGREQQVQILINLVLKNFSMQTNLKQNSILCSHTSINHGLGQTTNYYFEQLKRTDFQAYRSLKQYITFLEQWEHEDQRHENLQKDYLGIAQRQREHQILKNFSERLEELRTVQTVRLEKLFGKELFQSLEKREYRFLSEAVIWTEKKRVEEYIRHCSEETCRKIRKRLEETISETQRKQIPRLEDILEISRMSESEKKLERFRERLLLLLARSSQEEFRKIYQNILFPGTAAAKEESGAFMPGVIWRRTKGEMRLQIERMEDTEIHYFWETLPLTMAKAQKEQEILSREQKDADRQNVYQFCYNICRKFGDRLEKARNQYLSEMRKSLQSILLQVKAENVVLGELGSISLDDIPANSGRGTSDPVIPDGEISDRVILAKGKSDREISGKVILAKGKSDREISDRVILAKRKSDGEISDRITLVKGKSDRETSDKEILGREYLDKKFPDQERIVGENLDRKLLHREIITREKLIRERSAGEREAAGRRTSDVQVFQEYVQELERELLQRAGEAEREMIEREIQILKTYQDILPAEKLSALWPQQNIPPDFASEPMPGHDLLISEYEEKDEIVHRRLMGEDTVLQTQQVQDFIGQTEFREYGKALLVHPVQNADDFREQQENSPPETSGLQPETIRLQIENTKKGVRLRSLIEQLNRQLQGEEIHLVYRETQLENRLIQRLLAKTEQADEKTYKEIVGQLSEVILKITREKPIQAEAFKQQVESTGGNAGLRRLIEPVNPPTADRLAEMMKQVQTYEKVHREEQRTEMKYLELQVCRYGGQIHRLKQIAERVFSRDSIYRNVGDGESAASGRELTGEYTEGVVSGRELTREYTEGAVSNHGAAMEYVEGATPGMGVAGEHAEGAVLSQRIAMEHGDSAVPGPESAEKYVKGAIPGQRIAMDLTENAAPEREPARKYEEGIALSQGIAMEHAESAVFKREPAEKYEEGAVPGQRIAMEHGDSVVPGPESAEKYEESAAFSQGIAMEYVKSAVSEREPARKYTDSAAPGHGALMEHMEGTAPSQGIAMEHAEYAAPGLEFTAVDSVRGRQDAEQLTDREFTFPMWEEMEMQMPGVRGLRRSPTEMQAADGYGRQTEQILQYTAAGKNFRQEQQRAAKESREETLQIKSLQQQLDVRLREVEQKLQKAENAAAADAAVSVRDLADKVKRQLHEELHMERLRRGLT